MMILPQLRVFYLRILSAGIGRNEVIHSTDFFYYYRTGFAGLKASNDCFIGNDFMIDLADEATVLDSVTIAERVTILTHTEL